MAREAFRCDVASLDVDSCGAEYGLASKCTHQTNGRFFQKRVATLLVPVSCESNKTNCTAYLRLTLFLGV